MAGAYATGGGGAAENGWAGVAPVCILEPQPGQKAAPSFTVAPQFVQNIFPPSDKRPHNYKPGFAFTKRISAKMFSGAPD
jgi:hypothetical protein